MHQMTLPNGARRRACLWMALLPARIDATALAAEWLKHGIAQE